MNEGIIFRKYLLMDWGYGKIQSRNEVFAFCTQLLTENDWGVIVYEY